jgi:hypothetical protein
MPASIPIRHRGTLASRAVIRPREIFSRKTIAPLSSRPIKCRVFLPVSMPMVCATVAAVLWDIAMSPRASKPPSIVRGRSTAGPSHSRTSRPFFARATRSFGSLSLAFPCRSYRALHAGLTDRSGSRKSARSLPTSRVHPDEQRQAGCAIFTTLRRIKDLAPPFFTIEPRFQAQLPVQNLRVQEPDVSQRVSRFSFALSARARLPLRTAPR